MKEIEFEKMLFLIMRNELDNELDSGLWNNLYIQIKEDLTEILFRELSFEIKQQLRLK